MELAEWLKQYGYPDKSGVSDRINFSSPHTIDKKNSTTKLTLSLNGFDSDTKKITDANGSLDLVTTSGRLALSWSFNKILEHWSRKHQYAAYVPNQARKGKTRAYQYGHLVILGSNTNHELFLSGLAAGKIKYDPGLNIKKVSSEHPKEKKRNQFRIRATQLPRLYGTMEEVDLNNEY